MNFIQKQVIIFDTINSSNFSFVQDYLHSYNEVYFFSIDDKMKNNEIIKDYRKNNRLTNPLDSRNGYTEDAYSSFFANEDLDEIFAKYFSKSALIKNSCQLFQSDAITDMYKKRLLSELKSVYEKELIIKKISENSEKEICFYPDGYFELYQEKKFMDSKKIRVLKISNVHIVYRNIRLKLHNIFLLSYPWYILFKKNRFFGRKRNEKQCYHLGINVNLPDLFGYNYHYNIYISDPSYGNPKQDILYIDDRFGVDYEKEFENKGYNYFNFFYEWEVLSNDFIFNKFIRHFLPVWIKSLMYSFFEKNSTIEVTRTIFSDYIKWNIFFDIYALKNHFTMLLPDTISKNLIMEKNHCVTWFLWPDCYAGYHLPFEETKKTAIFTSLMKYDNGIFYGEKIARYFKYNKNDISKYHTIGILSSQRIRELKDGKYVSPLPAILAERGFKGKILGVFSVSPHEKWAMLDGIKFRNDLLMLLDENSGLFLIFKEKAFEDAYLEYPEYNSVIEKIQRHPRCLLIKKTRQNCVFSSDVIACSDLVISAAYTSPTIEALGAKTRAIYYDASNREIGEKFYLNNIPNFVAHDIDELRKFVHYWLYENTKKDFDLFLRDYVHGELDSYVDCHAIDRLQELLKKAS